MKTFEDLEWKPHNIGFGTESSKRATMDFPNGFGVSILLGSLFHSNGTDTYEVAIFRGDNIDYTTGITDDVMGYRTAKEVTEIMAQVQKLSKFIIFINWVLNSIFMR